MAGKKKIKLPKSRVKSKSKKNETALMPVKAISEKQNKSQILKAIADQTGLTGKQVQAVFKTTNHLVKCHLAKKGSGEFSIPEMAIKVMRKTKPATKSREGKNPFTGEKITIAAKPMRNIVKLRPLKSLKQAII